MISVDINAQFESCRWFTDFEMKSVTESKKLSYMTPIVIVAYSFTKNN
jgi:hypothetical protein